MAELKAELRNLRAEQEEKVSRELAAGRRGLMKILEAVGIADQPKKATVRDFFAKEFKRVEQHVARPKEWYCIHCGCFEDFNDYICRRCHAVRPFVGGSATMKECRRCSQWSLALAAYCEWCGAPYAESDQPHSPPLRTISLEGLGRLLDEICDGIEQRGEVWEVRTGATEEGFILGPPAICLGVLGLVDEEYGWPTDVDIKSIGSPIGLIPGHRRHPVLRREGRTVAMSISKNEYGKVLEKMRAHRG